MRRMTGPLTGPNSQIDPRSPVAERIAAERAAMSIQRPSAQPRLLHSAPAKLLGRRLQTAAPRHLLRAPQRHTGTSKRESENAPVETSIAPEPQYISVTPHPLLQIFSRAGRLTFDAMLLIVFAPVIAIWWLNEKRHKRPSRN